MKQQADRGMVPTAALAFFALMLGTGVCAAGTKTWNAGTNDWFVDGNWLGGGHPVAGDDVVITNAGATVLLTNSTAALSSLTISNTATLVFSNWNTTLSATNVTIMTAAVLTLPGAFTTNQMSNNVCIVCSNLTITSGGSINANGLGYAGGTNSPKQAGQGPGGGYGYDSEAYGSAASHGGVGHADGYYEYIRYPYDSLTAPVLPGSGAGSTQWDSGLAGGGAVRINATGVVTINGMISADADKSASRKNGGSGGAIWIDCASFLGSGGRLSADGANGASAGGGGGRIAINYQPAAQPAGVQNVTISAAGGSGNGLALKGGHGTIYLPDDRFVGTVVTNIIGCVWGFASLNRASLAVQSWLHFPTDGFALTVTNDVLVSGNNAMLEVGGPSFGYFGVQDRKFGVAVPTVCVGGSLTLTNGALMSIHAGQTNGAPEQYGALLGVTNNLIIGTNCSLYVESHPTNGGAVAIQAANCQIANSGKLCADILGYSGGWSNYTTGFGPQGGQGYTNSNNGSAGGGNGGSGGHAKYGNLGGGEDSSATAPFGPGSGGGHGYFDGGNGGGFIWLDVSGVVSNAGAITANGGQGGRGRSNAGGGAGGTIRIRCNSVAIGQGAQFNAIGGDRYGTSDGGGGGGRIGLLCNSIVGSSTNAFSVAPGLTGTSANYFSILRPDAAGSVLLPDATLLTPSMDNFLYARVVITSVSSLTFASLQVSNRTVGLEISNLNLTVSGDLTVVSNGCLVIGSQYMNQDLAYGLAGSGVAPRVMVAGKVLLNGGKLLLGGWGQKAQTLLTVTNDLVLTNASDLYVYAGETNAPVSTGAYVTVLGSTTLGNACWIHPHSQPTNGGSVLFSLRGVTIPTNAGFNADSAGYMGNASGGSAPGASAANNGGGGGGHGGRGGTARYTAVGAASYGSSNAPVTAGGGGGYAANYYNRDSYKYWLAGGGGSIQIEANTIALDGTLTACGGGPDANASGCGAGGGIFVKCQKLSATTYCKLLADGGDPTLTGTAGGGGGGRVAVWTGGAGPQRLHQIATGAITVQGVKDSFSGFAGTVSAMNHTNNAAVTQSLPGTIVFRYLPPPGGTAVVFR